MLLKLPPIIPGYTPELICSPQKFQFSFSTQV